MSSSSSPPASDDTASDDTASPETAPETASSEERAQDVSVDLPAGASETTDAASVDAVLAAVDTAVRDQQRAYVERIRADVLVPLQETLRSVLDAHAAARAAVDVDGDRYAAWAETVAYRHRVVDSVWRPVRATLAEIDVGDRIRRSRVDLRAARSDLADDLPAVLERPEPDALYASAPDDGVGGRLRKAGIRTGRRLRRLVSTPEPPVQEIPIAELVHYHASHRLREAQADTLDALGQRVARWVAQLERVAASWTHQLLEAERLLDAAAFHGTNGAPVEPADVAEDGGPPVHPDRLLAAVRDEANRLDEVLAAGLDLQVDDLADDLAATADRAHDELATDVARAGSFMARHVPETPPRRVRKRREERATRLQAWPAWHRQAVDRLALLAALCALRETVAAAQETLIAQVVAAGLDPVDAIHDVALDRLQAVTDEVDALLQHPDPGTERATLVALDRLAERITEAVQDELVEPLRSLSVRRRMADTVDLQVHALEAVVETQPSSFTVHPRPDPDADVIEPEEDGQEVAWRSMVRDTLDELLFDAWRDALPPLAAAADAATQRAEEVKQVVQFNLSAALEEMQDLVAARRRGQDAEGAVDNARELALDGLRRSMDLLRTGETVLSDVRRPFVNAVWTSSTRAWTRLHDRARAAGRAREHVLRIQSLLAHRLRTVAGNAQKRTREVTLRVKRALQVGRRRTEQLVQMGQSAVGVGAVDESKLQETVEALSSVEAVLETLPVVYRRLFSFRPVMDPNLLVARDDDLRVVQRHAAQWERGLANALVLTGPPGSGLTSTLNVLRKTTLRDARVHSVDLTSRIDSEAAFAVKVVRALGLEVDANEDLTLDAVAQKILDAPRPDRLRVCTVEHLEHAFLRTVEGTSLLARILGFLSETDTRVLWLGTMSSAAWQILRSYEPSAVGLVLRHELDDFDRAELEELIMCRHRRSGLRLDFEPPDESAYPLLARRVRSATDDARRQEILRTDFFDRLYTLCGQNVMLALFYWFRAVRLDPDDASQAVLHVRPLRPISFDYLETFSLSQAFALKALLEHATLTVGELAEVLQVDRASSRALLESLGNALLITSAGSLDPPSGFQFISIERGVRYRIRPLVIHPVTRFLRSRNIVH